MANIAKMLLEKTLYFVYQTSDLIRSSFTAQSERSESNLNESLFKDYSKYLEIHNEPISSVDGERVYL